MTAAARVLSQSARLGIDDFRSVYTWKSWLAGWLPRMLAQVAFFASIGLLVGSRAEIGYLLVGNAVVLVCLEATIVVISVSVERFQGTLPLFGLRPSPLRVLACLPVLVVIAVSSYCYGSFLASLVARFPQFNWLALNVGYLAVMTVAGVNVPVDFWPGPVQALANLLTALRAAGGGPEHLAALTIYIVDVPDYRAHARAIGEVWRRLAGRDYPATAGIGVARLWDDDALVEVQGVAEIPEQS